MRPSRRRAGSVRRPLLVALGTAVTAAALVTGAAGCGRTAGAARTPTAHGAGVQHVTIDATQSFRFTPAVVHVHVGQVVVTLHEVGAYPHNFVLPVLRVGSATVSSTPGSTDTTVTFVVPRPGTYHFFCAYHSQAGMTGELVAS